jgi:hypothetical protein
MGWLLKDVLRDLRPTFGLFPQPLQTPGLLSQRLNHSQ